MFSIFFGRSSILTPLNSESYTGPIDSLMHISFRATLALVVLAVLAAPSGTWLSAQSDNRERTLFVSAVDNKGEPVEGLGPDAFVIRATIENHGYLPTNGSDQAQRNGLTEPVEVEIEGAEPVLGKKKQQIGHLQGRSAARGMMFAFGMAKVDNERLLEWLVRGSGSCAIVARSEKGGTVRHEVTLA